MQTDNNTFHRGTNEQQGYLQPCTNILLPYTYFREYLLWSRGSLGLVNLSSAIIRIVIISLLFSEPLLCY